ncbi:hypothetical protein GW846_03815 [Candidatus Gracilibacteria bacterium]|nr:hypothetical protein [Candidatus Gracilibacteria bacterium]
MIFRKSRKTVSKNVGKVDKFITGIVITGAAASIFGLSRTEKGKQVSQKVSTSSKNIFQKGVTTFGKFTVGVLNIFSKKK